MRIPIDSAVLFTADIFFVSMTLKTCLVLSCTDVINVSGGRDSGTSAGLLANPKVREACLGVD